MIVDTHIHCTQPPSAERPYDPKGAHSDPLTPEQLFAEGTPAGVDKYVQVVPSTMGWDNRYGLEVVDQHPDRFVGAVVRLDPFAPDVEGRLRAAKAHPKMLGVRFTLSLGGTEEWLISGKLDPFFAIAEKIDTAVQLFAPYCNKEAKAAARRYPKLRWLIDHMGLRYYAGKDNRDSFRQWPELLALAEEPNVWIKVSYFPEAASDIEGYPYPTAQRRFKELYEHVGPDRLIWGSNFPPVRRVCTYRQAVDFMRVECGFLKPAELDAIMGGNFLKSFAR